MIRCTDGSGGTTDSPTAGGPPRNLHRKQGGIPGTPLMPPHRSHVGGAECPHTWHSASCAVCQSGVGGSSVLISALSPEAVGKRPLPPTPKRRFPSTWPTSRPSRPVPTYPPSPARWRTTVAQDHSGLAAGVRVRVCRVLLAGQCLEQADEAAKGVVSQQRLHAATLGVASPKLNQGDCQQQEVRHP